jgi:hypothetical protein
MNIYDIAKRIGSIQPGKRINIDGHLLGKIAPGAHLVGIGGPEWTPAERVMEHIVGSAYEFRFWTEPESGNVVFERLREPLKDGSRTYVSPDRREHYRLGNDGRYWPNAEPRHGSEPLPPATG